MCVLGPTFLVCQSEKTSRDKLDTRTCKLFALIKGSSCIWTYTHFLLFDCCLLHLQVQLEIRPEFVRYLGVLGDAAREREARLARLRRQKRDAEKRHDTLQGNLPIMKEVLKQEPSHVWRTEDTP